MQLKNWKAARMNTAVLNFRPALISTGELTLEACISDGTHQAYEASPAGQTTGTHEPVNEVLDPTRFRDFELHFASNLTQGEFDANLPSDLEAPLATAASMAYLRFSAKKANCKVSDLDCLSAHQVSRRNTLHPKLIFNILNGGPHGGNALTFCEFMIVPDALNVHESVRVASEVYCDLRDLLTLHQGRRGTLVGREGGFSPELRTNAEALDVISEAISRRNEGKVKVAIDVAATTFSRFEDGEFVYVVDEEAYNSHKLIEYFQELLTRFKNIHILEDPLNERDIQGLKALKSQLGDQVMVVADDVTVSRPKLIAEAKAWVDACVLKLNQAGTVSGLIEAEEACREAGLATILSQRSGETDSDILAHIAVGLNPEYVKAGAPARERIIKYNELMRLYE